MSKSKSGYTRRAFMVLGGAAVGSATMTGIAQAAHSHPKIVAAISALEEVHAYLKTASHHFGGHKKEAMGDVNKAIRQLRLCLGE
ncbi:MAG: hypothetical protein WCJ35_02030 [Planctomycetota bacterium]